MNKFRKVIFILSAVKYFRILKPTSICDVTSNNFCLAHDVTCTKTNETPQMFQPSFAHILAIGLNWKRDNILSLGSFWLKATLFCTTFILHVSWRRRTFLLNSPLQDFVSDKDLSLRLKQLRPRSLPTYIRC